MEMKNFWLVAKYFKNKSPLNHIFAHLQRVNVGQKAPKQAEWALLNHLG